jgi:hypothetical protein
VVDAAHLHHLEEPVVVAADVLTPEAKDAVGVELDRVAGSHRLDVRLGQRRFGLLGGEHRRCAELVVEKANEIEQRPPEDVLVVPDGRQPRHRVEHDAVGRGEPL